MSRAKTEYRYEKLTWPEINDAVDLGKVCIVPCGAVEQHGPHLPLDVDLVCPQRHRQRGRASRSPTRCWCCRSSPTATPGTSWTSPARSTTTSSTSCTTCSTSPRSLAYHGFKKIVLLNGHGSNMPNLDLVARRTNLETDAECVLAAWWNLLTVDKDVPAALAAEQVPRRLRPRLRAGDVAVPLPRRRQRPQGPDQERHDQLQRGGQPVQLGRPVRAPARRRSSRGRAATPRPACWARRSWPRPRRAGRPTRRRSSSWSAS